MGNSIKSRKNCATFKNLKLLILLEFEVLTVIFENISYTFFFVKLYFIFVTLNTKKHTYISYVCIIPPFWGQYWYVIRLTNKIYEFLDQYKLPV